MKTSNRPTPFVAMVRKELRENLKWAALIFLVAAVAMVYGLDVIGVQGQHSYNPSMAFGITSDRFFAMNAVVSAAAAFALGILQIVFESRRDAWAFLVHRPVARSTLFYAKAAAGVLLYLPALLLPFAAAAIYTATPGHYPAPFSMQMVVPGLFDIATGVVYYFAGLIVAVRHARWYVSRIVPLVFAMIGSFFVLEGPTLWFPIIALLIAIPVSLLAARDAFLSAQTSEPFHHRPVTGKIALVITLIVGWAGIAGFLTGISFLVFAPRNIQWGGILTRNEISTDGAPILVYYNSFGGQLTNATDLQGHALPWAADKDATSKLTSYILASDHYITAANTDSEQYKYAGYYSYRSFLYLYVPIQSAYGSDLLWYYSIPDGRFLSYNVQTYRLVGSAGPDGYVPGELRPSAPKLDPSITDVQQSFMYGIPNGVIATPNRVYHIDFKNPELTTLYATEPASPIIDAGSMAGMYGYGFPYPLLVSKHDGLLVVGTDGQVMAHLPQVGTKDQYCDLSRIAGETPASGTSPPKPLPSKDRYFIKIQSLHAAVPERVMEFSADGTVVRTVDYPLNTSPPYVADHTQEYVSAPLIPPAALAITMAIRACYSAERHEMLNELPMLIRMGALSVLSGTLCAVATFLIARQYFFRRSHRIFWTIANFLLGPLGLLTFLSLQTFPLRVKCPSCKKPRPITAPLCPHCQAAFPEPEADGTEILEPLTTSEMVAA